MPTTSRKEFIVKKLHHELRLHRDITDPEQLSFHLQLMVRLNMLLAAEPTPCPHACNIVTPCPHAGMHTTPCSHADMHTTPCPHVAHGQAEF